MLRWTIVLSVVLAACGGGLQDLADRTCAQLDGAIMLQVGPILTGALAEAEDAGYSALDLGDALRAKCPGLMAAIDEFGSEQEALDNLINEVSLELEGCFSDEARGTVTNDSDRDVSVYVDVEFLDGSGVVVESGIGSVSGLRPGETGAWTAFFFGDVYARCRAEVGSVFED